MMVKRVGCNANPPPQPILPPHDRDAILWILQYAQNDTVFWPDCQTATVRIANGTNNDKQQFIRVMHRHC